VVSVLLGILLLAAAILKVHADANTPDDLGQFKWIARVGLLAESAVELALGAALVAGIWPAVIRRVALLFFVIVSCVAIFEAIRAQPDCGCFGKFSPPPWVTALMDVASVTALLVCQPRLNLAASSRRLYIGGAILLAGVGTCITIEATRPHLVRISLADLKAGTEDFGPPGSLVVLEPAKWIGHRLPISGHIDVGDQLMHGRWIVLLVHHDCQHCLAAITQYEDESANNAGKKDVPRLAVIEMPPYGQEGQKLAGPSTLAGSLDTQREWFASTPVALLLEDGIVRDSLEASAVAELKGEWWKGEK
jgi:hypothetical protein